MNNQLEVNMNDKIYKDTLKNVLGSVGFIQKENKNYYLKRK